MSELAILLARVLSISKFSSSLLKCFLKISASSSLCLIVLLLLFKIIDSLWIAFSEKRGPTVFHNFLLSETTLWSSFPKKRLIVLRSKLTQKFIWQLKRLLDSTVLVFQNLFLSFDLFVIDFLSSLVIKFQLFEHIFFVFFSFFLFFFFLERACQEQITNTVSINFDSGAFATSNFNNSFFKSWRKLSFSTFL